MILEIFNASLKSSTLKVFAVYFLIESTVWLIYYTILRRFFEERYSIYHPIEYFVLIPILLCSQAVAISIIYTLAVDESFLILMGLSEIDKIPFYIKMIGILYLAFVLSMILNGFPSEKRKSDNYYSITIFGFGDVVTERLLPALDRSYIRKNIINIYTIKIIEHNNKDINLFDIKKLNNRLDDVALSKIIWICTPSYSHIEYLEKFMGLNSLIVIEKPISVNLNELNILKKMKSYNLLDNVFFLSYYKLEKSLPLTYLIYPSIYYAKYLEFKNADKESLSFFYSKLGNLKSLSINLIEGMDNRDWPYKDEYGGHLLETFIHPVVIASQYVEIPQNWKDLVWNIYKGEKNKELMYELKAISKGVDVHLRIKKNAKKNDLKKSAEFVYENGKIIADFNKKKIKIFNDKSGQSIEIKVKNEFNGNYDVQVDLVKTVYEDKITPSLIDGFEQQIEIIEWLINQKSESNL
ncbi:Gfo/Idh/MocA family oxidoreductase [Marinirhabdus gelatinilytica]|uniref:Gfo/Idh/MocA family oxidoreductase n=1 Tax=Marinirhabdus gelatinilytica TaxID=1703343 RepID=UPI001472A33A|nr:Gfo/Idh/MocA family oxidoreductase [Marinirhabdus gelatinilytica]